MTIDAGEGAAVKGTWKRFIKSELSGKRRRGMLLAAGAGICWVLSVGCLVAYLLVDEAALLIGFMVSALALPIVTGSAALRLVAPIRGQRRLRATQLTNSMRQIAMLANQTAMKANSGIEAVHGSGATDASRSELVLIGKSLHSLGEAQGLRPRSYMSIEQAVAQIRAELAGEGPLGALPWLREFENSLSHLTLSECRTLAKYYRRTGYLEQSALIIEHLAERYGKESDKHAAMLYRSELSFYQGIPCDTPTLPPYTPDPASNRVLHLVGKCLPETQSGYTLRTQYTVKAQQRSGLDPIVVGQVGATDRQHDLIETYDHEGIRYYLLGGAQRGQVGWHAWLQQNIEQLAEVVRLTRPFVLHAHSDFINSLIAQTVGNAYGIPVVNETRGFWEESWLSRTATAEGWKDLKSIEEKYGLPDMYRLRVEREAQARHEADHVVTLAGVMERHIRDVGDALHLPVQSVSLAPNAVNADEFPVVERSEELVAELGIPADAVVLGYISSIVEYEGIDTLIEAVYQLNSASKEARTAVRNPLVEAEHDRLDGSPAVDSPPHSASVGIQIAGSPESVSTLRAAIGNAVGLYGRAEGVSEPAIDYASASNIQRSGLVDALRRIYSETKEEDLVGMTHRLLSAVTPVSDVPIHLLIVGGGPVLGLLQKLSDDLGVTNVTFTDRIPHQLVLDYYSIIDLFVIPRKPVAVTRLVTPLKPFEAFSTGRPGLFSDVEALAEIAEESGGAATFRAGDAHDLAIRIGELLQNPDRLAAMSTAGAQWVREERTWDLNAYKYLSTYRKLGMEIELPQHAQAQLDLRADGMSSAEFVQRLERGDTPSVKGWHSLGDKSRAAGPRGGAYSIINQGWTGDKHSPIVFVPGLDWDAISRENRSWGFKLHTWEFMDLVLTEYQATRDLSLLTWAMNVALDWDGYVSRGLPKESMAWYDMALSLRMPRLARLMVALAKSELRSETTRFIRIAVEHSEMSMADEAFNAGNNHGFYCAMAQCDFAKWLPSLPGVDALKEMGQRRLALMLERQFAGDGGHLEHSPDYHRMLLSSFEKAIDEGLIQDEEIAERVSRASHVVGWMVQPDGNLVQFGDTPLRRMSSDRPGLDQNSRFIFTDGKMGVPNDAEMAVFPDSGYAFVRSPQPANPGDLIKSSYLAFMASFHSRAHKHADDLTFTWFDRGRELLVDSGRFGYVDLLPADSPDRQLGFYYGSAERQYVESTIAHNTVSVDGLDIERRARKPYGSGIRECAVSGSEFVLRGEVSHSAYVHSRQLTLAAHQSLVVNDRLTKTGSAEHAVAWFNLDGSLDVSVEDEWVRVRFEDRADSLWISGSGTLIPPVRGQVEPLRGWRSRIDGAIEPVWNLGFGSLLGTVTDLTTRFEFSVLRPEA